MHQNNHHDCYLFVLQTFLVVLQGLGGREGVQLCMANVHKTSLHHTQTSGYQVLWVSNFCHNPSNLIISALLAILQSCKLDYKVAIKCTWAWNTYSPDQLIGSAIHPPNASIIYLASMKARKVSEGI